MHRIVIKMLITLVVTCIIASPAWAVAVYLKDSDDPVLGFVKSRTATHLSIIVTTDGLRSERLIPVEEIAEVLETVSPKRLTELNPGRLTDYRDYAEELMVKRADPEAREAAIRLFLITAFYGEDNMRASAMRGLVSLARTGDERRRFLALGYRYGAIDLPGASTAERPTNVASEVQLTEEQQSQLANIIRSSRAGFSRRVRTQAMASEVKTMFSENDLGMTHKEFIDLISGSDLGPVGLRALVELELRSLNRFDTGASSSDGSEEAGVDWAQVAADGDTVPVAILDITNVTEFDPNACYFVEGRWQESH